MRENVGLSSANATLDRSSPVLSRSRRMRLLATNAEDFKLRSELDRAVDELEAAGGDKLLKVQGAM